MATDSDLSWPAKMIGYGALVLARENLDLFLDELPERSIGDPIAL